MEFVDILQYYIRSELVVLIPVLYLLGLLLRKSKISNHRIPMILLTVSLIITGFYTFAVCSITTIRDFYYSVFSILTQGILLAGSEIFIKDLLNANFFKRKECPSVSAGAGTGEALEPAKGTEDH